MSEAPKYARYAIISHVTHLVNRDYLARFFPLVLCTFSDSYSQIIQVHIVDSKDDGFIFLAWDLAPNAVCHSIFMIYLQTTVCLCGHMRYILPCALMATLRISAYLDDNKCPMPAFGIERPRLVSHGPVKPMPLSLVVKVLICLPRRCAGTTTFCSSWIAQLTPPPLLQPWRNSLTMFWTNPFRS